MLILLESITLRRCHGTQVYITIKYKVRHKYHSWTPYKFVISIRPLNFRTT